MIDISFVNVFFFDFPFQRKWRKTSAKDSFLLFPLVDPVIIWWRRGGGEPLCRMWQLWQACYQLIVICWENKGEIFISKEWQGLQ